MFVPVQYNGQLMRLFVNRLKNIRYVVRIDNVPRFICTADRQE